MTKQEKIASFDPNGAGLKDANVFGLPFTPEESDIVLIPVPWEVTTSYGAGASKGPEHILEASFQVDLHHPDFPELWKSGIAMIDLPEELALRSASFKQKAQTIIERWEDGVDVDNDPESQTLLHEINEACQSMNLWVEQQTTHWMALGKKVGLIGGDHSTPLGYFKALANKHGEFGILHVDAHMDLRLAFEGFTYSHASIMYNALREVPAIKQLVQVGIRDFCIQEKEVADSAPDRVVVFYNAQIKRLEFEGKNWRDICDDIVGSLPKKVHISFDIDGLDPTLCPNTGTPVPGGLSFDQATYLLNRLKHSGHEIIGFDLVEVAPGDDDWNGNVGARLLFHLCGILQ